MVTKISENNPRALQSDETKLRIVQHKGVKWAIRLETIFWSQLTDFAREDRTTLSRLVFDIITKAGNLENRTAHLRCYCLDRLRRKQPLSALVGASFDMLALVSACPTPVTIITAERRMVAFNPAFSALLQQIRGPSRERDRAINLTFSEPMPKILKHCLDNPTEIRVYHIGLQVGETAARQFRARFALAEREKGASSLIIIYLEP